MASPIAPIERMAFEARIEAGPGGGAFGRRPGWSPGPPPTEGSPRLGPPGQRSGSPASAAWIRRSTTSPPARRCPDGSDGRSLALQREQALETPVEVGGPGEAQLLERQGR